MLLLLIRAGGGLGIASIILLLLGTQWYILFNVIAGAIAIPTDLKECCSVFRMKGIERWKKLILSAAPARVFRHPATREQHALAVRAVP